MPQDPAESSLKSLAKVMGILECFSTVERSLSLLEICQFTGLPKSTAHRLLVSMREAGLVEQDRRRDQYRLGMKLLELGNTVLANMELHREARPFIDALTRQSGETVHLAVFDGYRAIVIHRADPAPEKMFLPAAIEQAPVHCTGVGKAILAFQPHDIIERVIKAGLQRYTEATITTPKGLLKNLKVTRQYGYAIDDREHQPSVRCVGAPIRDQSGRIMAGISVSAPARRLSVDDIHGMAKVVVFHADGLARALGYRS